MTQSPDHHTIRRMYKRLGGQGRAPLKQADHVRPTGTGQGYLGHGCPTAGLSGADLPLNLNHVFSCVIPRNQGYAPSEVTALYLEVAVPQQWVKLLAWRKRRANGFIQSFLKRAQK